MLVYVKKEDEQFSINTNYDYPTLRYKVIDDKLKLSEDELLRQPEFNIVFADQQYGFYIQPYDNRFIQNNKTTINGQNIVNNISGIIDQESNNNVYKLAQQIGKGIDNFLFNSPTIPIQNEGNFKFTDQQLIQLLEEHRNRVYFRYKTDFVHGQIEIRAGSKQFIPLQTLTNYQSQQFMSIKPVPQFTGLIESEEQIFVEPVLDNDSGSLIANFFGIRSGYSYKSVVLSHFADRLHGFNYDGRYLYQLIDGGLANTYYINTVLDQEINTRLIKYDLQTDELQLFNVQYQPLYCDGIVVFGGLILIKDIQGVVVCEFVDQSYDLGEDITLKFPFTHYTVCNYQIGDEELTGSLDDNPIVDVTVRVIGGFNNQLMQSSKLDVFDQSSIVNEEISYESIELTPTYIDSMQYLSGLDRQTLETIQHLYERIFYQPDEEPINTLYPIAISMDQYEIIDDSLLLNILDSFNEPTSYMLLMPGEYKSVLTQITDYTKLFNSLNEFKDEISYITGIPLSQLEKQPGHITDNMTTHEIRLVDGVRPVQVKFYKPDIKVTINILRKADGSIWHQQMISDVSLYDVFADQAELIDNNRVYIQLSEIPQSHTVEIQDVPYRNLQAGRIIGIVEKNKIKYSF